MLTDGSSPNPKPNPNFNPNPNPNPNPRPTGCGKSSVLAALLGELHLLGGEAHTAADSGGSVGYCGQQVWVGRGTVRHNVLFGRSLDEARYTLRRDQPQP